MNTKHNRPFWAGVGSNSLFFNLEYECVTIKLRISEKSDFHCILYNVFYMRFVLSLFLDKGISSLFPRKQQRRS